MKKEIDLNKMKYFETKVVRVKKENKDFWCGGMTIDGKQYKVFKRKKDIPYLKEFSKGNWVNGENLDEIKFPCFCSYINGSTKYYGEIHHSRYYGLYRIEGQGIHSFVDEMSSLRRLIEVYNIHILKGKIIIFEEEK